MAAHMAFARSKIVKTAMPVYAVLIQHVYQHMGMKAELAARQELGMPPMQPPTPEQPEDPTSMDPKLQSRVAQLIAEYTVAFSKIEDQFTDGADSDEPIVQLKSRELDLREQENQRKAVLEKIKIEQDRLQEAAKLRQQQKLADERLASQENLANMRASLDLTKMFMAPPKTPEGPKRN
jgi:hypothetical protein